MSNIKKKNKKKYPGVNNGGKENKTHMRAVIVKEEAANKPLLSRNGFKKENFAQLM